MRRSGRRSAISYERLQKSSEAAAAYQEYLRLSPMRQMPIK
jgi:hypothetical protein